MVSLSGYNIFEVYSFLRECSYNFIYIFLYDIALRSQRQRMHISNSTQCLQIHVNFSILSNIGITHVFSCINICRVPRMLFEHEADKPSVQHHPRDPASVNAMKQTYVIVILA